MSKLYILYRLKGKGLTTIKDLVSEDIQKRCFSFSQIKEEYMRSMDISWDKLKGEPQLEFPTSEED